MLVIFVVKVAGMLLFPSPTGMQPGTETDLARLVVMSSPEVSGEE